eukprot:scaffold22753_cov108-Isochrysis_galbana.AAC.3
MEMKNRGCDTRAPSWRVRRGPGGPRRERGEEKKKKTCFWVVLRGWPTGAELAGGGGDALGKAWCEAPLARRAFRA